MRYYSTQPYLRRKFDSVDRQLAFDATNRSEMTDWRRKLTGTLRKLTGYDTMIKTPLNPRVTDEVEFRDYTRQRVEIQTEPGLIMPMFVLIPKRADPPYRAIIAPHGHGSGGKFAVAGCREMPRIAAAIRKYNYAYGQRFAKAGFLTLCPDARGFGERQEEPDRSDILSCSCQWLNNMALPLGQTVTGMWTWDLHRLLDYVQTRSDVKPDRIGCAGLSGGGHQTLWATALDKRIRCAVISGYLYGYKESLLEMFTNCSCNYVPHLYEYADMGDIAALIAPRPLLIETGTMDPLNGASGLKNVSSQVHIIRKAYRLLQAEKNLKHVIFQGSHRWYGAETVSWVGRHL